jgi:ribosomal protein L22
MQETIKPRRMQEKVAAAPVQEKKSEIKEMKPEAKPEVKHDVKPEVKQETKVEKPKKTEVIARGMDMGISTKHAMAICDFIRNRKIKDVIPELEQVVKLKRAIPMKGEIPHRHGDMMSGRYPVNASKAIITLLKGLDANARASEILEPKIVFAKPDKASSPHRRFGSRRFKRTHILLIAKESGEEKKEKKEAKK